MKYLVVGVICALSSVGVYIAWGLGAQLAVIPLFAVFGTYVGKNW